MKFSGSIISRVARLLRRGSATKRDPLGPEGERAAARLLRRSGYRVLSRNVRTPIGEVDLLCLAPDRRTIVAVEVKSRRIETGRDDGFTAPGSADGDGPRSARPVVRQPSPEASVHAHKRRKLTALLRHLARANGWTDRPLRIDVVAVEFHAKRKPTLRHHVNAVTAGM